eukprot:GILJ01006947.1.p1 GENE.GILJ01006947.1~~GILJ01006947.1.p1  ORF type:complete len:112 (-),score=9.04 GILJ01006947.1:161-496(-)
MSHSLGMIKNAARATYAPRIRSLYKQYLRSIDKFPGQPQFKKKMLFNVREIFRVPIAQASVGNCLDRGEKGLVLLRTLSELDEDTRNLFCRKAEQHNDALDSVFDLDRDSY